MTYYIRANSQRQFTIERLGAELYSVLFSDWMKQQATAQLHDSEYTFDKPSWWSSDRTIYKNNVPIGSMSFGWSGHLTLNLTTDENTDLAYVLKSRGVFRPRIELVENGSNRLLLVMYAESNWFKYNYRIEELNVAAIHYPISELLGILSVGAAMIQERQNSYV